MADFPKNARRNAEIVERRKRGEWPSQIAERMGISRNAVIGVCNRAGLCSPNGYARYVVSGARTQA